MAYLLNHSNGKVHAGEIRQDGTVTLLCQRSTFEAGKGWSCTYALPLTCRLCKYRERGHNERRERLRACQALEAIRPGVVVEQAGGRYRLWRNGILLLCDTWGRGFEEQARKLLEALPK